MKKREVKDKQTVVKKEKEVHKKSDLLKKLIPILLVAIVLIAMIYYQITKTGSTHTQEPKKEVEISFKEVKGNQTIIENTGTEEIEKIKVFVDDRLVDEIEVNLKPNESITITFVPPLEAEKNHTIKLIAILPSGGSFVFEFTVPSSEATPSDGYIYLAPCEFPTFGEWIVNKSTYCGDTIINLNGNLTIRTGGEITYPLLPFSTALFLHNVTLRINSSYDGEYGIQVGDMGALYVLNSKITNGDFEDANFFFEVRPGATLQINNSELSGCGFNSTELWGQGLFIPRSNTIISNSRIYRNHIGIITESNIQISNNIIEQNVIGVYCINADPSLTGNVFINNSYNCISCPRCPS